METPELNPYAAPQTFDPIAAEVISSWMDQIEACPTCQKKHVMAAPYNPDRGRAGPRAIDHLICLDCGTEYNGETGRAIKNYLTWNVLIPLLAVAFGIAAFVAFVGLMMIVG